MFRRMICFTLALCFVAGLMGCATSTPSPTTVAPTSSPTTATTKAITATTASVTTVGKPVAIKMWMGSWWEQKAPEIVKKFQADFPNRTLAIDCLPVAGYLDNAVAATLAGNPPDIIDEDVTGVASLADKNLITELPDLAKQLKASDFDSSCWTLSQFNGKMYAVPSRGSSSALFYNKTMFDNAKVAYPTADWTWADYLAAAQKITVAGQLYGASIAAAVSDPQNVMTSFAPVLWAFGGNFMNADNTKSVLDSPESIKGITFWVELFTKYKVVPEGSVNYTTSKDVIPLFQSNKVAMLISGENSISAFQAIKGLNWDLTEVPGKMNRGGGWTFTIPITAAHPNEAKEFIMWFIKPENASVLSARAPGNINAYTVAPWNTREYVVMRDASKNSKTVPSFGKWTESQNIIISELQKMLQGQKTPEQGAKDMTTQINALLKN